MKVRCANNSIRLRLRKSELQVLGTVGKVSESVAFPLNVSFSTELIIAKDATDLQAQFENGIIKVSIPETIASAWINSEQVGIERTIRLEDKQELKVLIEKDFPCLDRPNEDKSDTFWELAPQTPKTC